MGSRPAGGARHSSGAAVSAGMARPCVASAGTRAILAGLVVLVLLFPATAADPPSPDIEMFTHEGCP